MKVQILLGLLALGVPNAQPSVRSPVPAAGVVYTPPFTGSVQRPQSSKNADTVSVKDFGAVGDGVANDNAAILAAQTAAGLSGGVVDLPCPGTYKTTSFGTLGCGRLTGGINSTAGATVSMSGPFVTNSPSSAVARLYITDGQAAQPPNDASSPPWEVYPFVIAHASSGGPGASRPLLYVHQTGGLEVYDFVRVCPGNANGPGACTPAVGSMYGAGSDLGSTGVVLSLTNGNPIGGLGGGDFVWMNSWVNPNFDAGTRKFTFANNGFQNSSARNIVRNSSAPPDCAAATLNLTVTQFLEAAIFTCGTAQTVNFPTWQGASGIIQALPGKPAVGDVVQVIGAATGAGAITLGFGTGGTNGNAGHTTIPANSTQTITCRLTSVTANSETATCY